MKFMTTSKDLLLNISSLTIETNLSFGRGKPCGWKVHWYHGAKTVAFETSQFHFYLFYKRIVIFLGIYEAY